jgi:hypothetical protein
MKSNKRTWKYRRRDVANAIGVTQHRLRKLEEAGAVNLDVFTDTARFITASVLAKISFNDLGKT